MNLTLETRYYNPLADLLGNAAAVAAVQKAYLYGREHLAAVSDGDCGSLLCTVESAQTELAEILSLAGFVQQAASSNQPLSHVMPDDDKIEPTLNFITHLAADVGALLADWREVLARESVYRECVAVAGKSATKRCAHQPKSPPASPGSP